MRLALTLGLGLCASCASGAALRYDDGLQAERLEMAVDASGELVEIEYHVDPAIVPPQVQRAMEELHPGGRVTGAEKEYHGSDLFWELAMEIDGYAVEGMFRPDGTLEAQEAEVPTSRVPDKVKRAATGAGYGAVHTWEEIRDGALNLDEYHAKSTLGGQNFKLVLSVGGELRRVLREVEAEVEVPVQ